MSTTAESFLVGLVGSGITASLTPPMHEEEAARLGLRYLYRPVDLDVIGRPGTAVGELLRAGRDLGFNAFNITHPCKQLVIDHLDELVPQAAALQAVNTVLVVDGRLVGYNTDRTGFATGLAAELPDVPRSTVLQIGTGGAGAAVAAALVDTGVQRLVLTDADPARARARAAVLQEQHADREFVVVGTDRIGEVMETADGVVNATPIGMHHHPGTPLPADRLRPDQWVADVVYLPIDTPLVQAARARGCRVLDGGHMAVGQAADAFALITGITPDRTRMRDHFLRLVGGGPD
ncbi:shikimate dehydrogenase (NADP(+)) [Tersicoccus solisilvae]|uniref:Shikimate dehydrogenase (NADP(+)) n=1 Tax=Tersicoccus solisilvae TaxID=1882339 RepID=A0ABQ1NQN3_9MICC|nr:shikimate dehydrogenase [Tersicoccus solisilvae]GGC83032.1 shikimate dehydrogenase (NADP(+)) [Tersicoccus solisilvae]